MDPTKCWTDELLAQLSLDRGGATRRIRPSHSFHELARETDAVFSRRCFSMHIVISLRLPLCAALPLLKSGGELYSVA